MDKVSKKTEKMEVDPPPPPPQVIRYGRVGSSITLRKVGGKLAVNMCYVLTADVTIDSFIFKRSVS